MNAGALQDNAPRTINDAMLVVFFLD